LHIQLYNYFPQNQFLQKNQSICLNVVELYTSGVVLYQYGFVINSSTSDAVLDIYNEIILQSNEQKITCSLFLDLVKAFDYLDHDILLKKLKNMALRGSHKII